MHRVGFSFRAPAVPMALTLLTTGTHGELDAMRGAGAGISGRVGG